MINKTLYLSFMIIFITLPALATPKVDRITVGRQKTITKTLLITPGNGAAIEFPGDILEVRLIDDRLFQCLTSQISKKSLTCKTLTGEEYSTNLYVLTDRHNFILRLEVAAIETDTPDMYIFESEYQDTELEAVNQDTMISQTPDEDLIQKILNDYSHKKCSAKSKNQSLTVYCLEKIQIGTDSFMRFKIINNSKSPVTIVSCQIVIQTMGGLTGLTIKSESPEVSDYNLQNKILHFDEETLGVIKVPNTGVHDNQRMVFKIQTDQADGKNLFLTGVSL